MPSRNYFEVMGHVARDAELRAVGDTSVLKFSVGVSRGKKKNGEDAGTDWIPCEMWGRSAELHEEWGVRKGDLVLCCGKLRTNYDKEKDKNYYSLVIAPFGFENLEGWRRHKNEKQGIAEDNDYTIDLGGGSSGEDDIPF